MDTMIDSIECFSKWFEQFKEWNSIHLAQNKLLQNMKIKFLKYAHHEEFCSTEHRQKEF